MTMQIIPAIDLRGGKVVRLAQGDYARETRYPVEPADLARSYATAGAQWLHVVDLDGARSGALENLRIIQAIAATGMQVQAGGGVRSEGDLQRLFDAGVARAVVGSVAVRDPEHVENWIARYGDERICIALDTRADAAGWWTLPVKGWTEVAPSGLDELARRYARVGARHLLCTDIDRDGMMSGPNFALYAHLREIVPELAVQASGGVRGVDDLRSLRDGGAAAAILGRSLLEGRLTLVDALQC
ncbi:MAG TPA: 1-(5-phosphoribosyl)-5-[(5-phosphoribosylamino)methylideneamino]imidazole-4-carboxamide isomerase [Rudaea sp.]|nr:1-(5-phosphoribosyl)-5-[(5-phosphoribosylamino)methylideneamino]imidazole-4-carboxamide isomerase [Rudaea sp.]